MQFIAVEVFIYLFRIFVFSYKTLFVCVKDRPCLKIAILAYRFNIFGSVFGVLFCLLVKELILEVKASEKHEKFPCALWSLKTFPHMNKEVNFFFLKTAQSYGLIFLDNYLFIRLENFKTSLLILATNFSEKKRYQLWVCPNDIHTFWLLITLCNMPKGLVT